MNLRSDMAMIALQELSVMASLVDDLRIGDFDRPTALPGWTVEQLVRHVTAVSLRQGEAFHRARFTITEAPTDATVTAPREQLAPTLRSVLEHCTVGVTRLETSDDGPIVPLPFASLPASLAGYVLLVEYGVHRFDLEKALSGVGTLAPDVANAMADLVGLTLPSLAASSDPPVDRIRFEPHGRSATTLSWQSGKWRMTQDPESSCVVQGPADALALFIAGRIPWTDERLAIQDTADGLRYFKAMFPGP
jgi:uncharacterized protein (TIGR03083 family)